MKTKSYKPGKLDLRYYSCRMSSLLDKQRLGWSAGYDMKDVERSIRRCQRMITKLELAAANGWQLIDWDGNPELGLKCWRKKFGRGYVSVGVGDFTYVVFSYGANSDDSYSSTRWDYDRPVITEEEAMRMVDAGNGKTMVGRKPKPDNWN